MKKILFIFTILIFPLFTFAQMKSMVQDIQYKYEAKYVQLSNDVKIAYIDEGKGDQTIIFVHGLGSYLAAWQKNVDVLKDDYRCIAIDLPGYGKSSKAPHSGKMSFYADIIAEVIDSLNLGSVVVAGHSMGGQIAMVLALNYPEKVQKLILTDPAGFEVFTPGQKEWFKDVMTPNGVKNTSLEAIEVNLAVNFYNMPKDAKFMIDDRIEMRTADDFYNYCYAVSKSVAGMVDEPVYDILDKIQQPTLIFFGKNDNLIPNRYLNPGRTDKIAIDGASRIPNSKLVLVPKCGHFMMFEKPDEFNSNVKEFLK